jgi:hypothetical protein
MAAGAFFEAADAEGPSAFSFIFPGVAESFGIDQPFLERPNVITSPHRSTQGAGTPERPASARGASCLFALVIAEQLFGHFFLCPLRKRTPGRSPFVNSTPAASKAFRIAISVTA